MIVYTICYMAAYLAAAGHWYLLSGLSLMFAAACLYLREYKKNGNLLSLYGLFCLFFVGGEGIACLKLSYLSPDWQVLTWLSLYLFVLLFDRTYHWFLKSENTKKSQETEMELSPRKASRLFLGICGLTGVVLLAFLVEVIKLGFLPLFVRNVPHAYSTFHITGLHYFTVSAVLIPALVVLYVLLVKDAEVKKKIVVLLCLIIALLVPILSVSRFQLIFAVGLACIQYLLIRRKVHPMVLAASLSALVFFYILLTIARSHDTTYLNTVFEMKRNFPIYLTQPYTYIANNYDNFDCLIKNIQHFSYGKASLTPVWTLTGLKFFYPSLMELPMYVTKDELTTLTIVYDAYRDFGIPGVALFGALLGCISAWLMRLRLRAENPIFFLFYAQFAMYMIVSFFTTWFSNPTTWFYFAVTAGLALLVG